MDIKDIVKNAPDGATSYKVFIGKTEYYGLIGGNWCFYAWGLNKWKVDEFKNYKDATPLSPRTSVEYEKVEDKHSITIEQFEYEGVNFYFRHPNCRQYVEMNRFTLYEKLRDNKPIYRRIETPITDREDFIERASEASDHHGPTLFGKLYDAGCRFVGE